MGLLDPMTSAKKCHATSKVTGRQCGHWAIRGGTVCRYHGGAAPQVMAKAQERLAALVDPALARLGKLVDADAEAVQLGAVKDILDRNGFKPKEQVKVDADVTFTLRFDRHQPAVIDAA